jgi:hypothetical protein
MAWQLVVEAMDHAPRALTSTERFLLAIIAEYVQDPRTRECEKSTEDLAHRMGTSTDGVRKTLGNLRTKGVDVRVPIDVDRRGAPIYTYRGRIPRYRLPAFTPPEDCPCYRCRKAPEGGTDGRPSEGGTYGTPSDREGGNHGTPSRSEGGKHGAEGGKDRHERREESPAPPVPGDPVAAAAPPPPATKPEDQIVAALARRLDVDYPSAARIVAEVERKRSPGNLGGYLRSMPEADLRAFLAPTAAPRAAASAPPRSGGLPPLCGRCDARPGDPPTARIEWLDDDRTRSRPCPRCHPARQEVSPDAA